MKNAFLLFISLLTLATFAGDRRAVGVGTLNGVEGQCEALYYSRGVKEIKVYSITFNGRDYPLQSATGFYTNIVNRRIVDCTNAYGNSIRNFYGWFEMIGNRSGDFTIKCYETISSGREARDNFETRLGLDKETGELLHFRQMYMMESREYRKESPTFDCQFE